MVSVQVFLMTCRIIAEEGGPNKSLLPAWEREGPCLLTAVHTLSWSGTPCCVLCHWLCLPQSHYFGRLGLTLLFLLGLLVLSWWACALKPLVGLVGIWWLCDHARALQSCCVVRRPAARVGQRGRGGCGGLLVPISKVRDGQGSVARGRRGGLAVATFFSCWKTKNYRWREQNSRGKKAILLNLLLHWKHSVSQTTTITLYTLNTVLVKQEKLYNVFMVSLKLLDGALVSVESWASEALISCLLFYQTSAHPPRTLSGFWQINLARRHFISVVKAIK